MRIAVPLVLKLFRTVAAKGASKGLLVTSRWEVPFYIDRRKAQTMQRKLGEFRQQAFVNPRRSPDIDRANWS